MIYNDRIDTPEVPEVPPEPDSPPAANSATNEIRPHLPIAAGWHTFAVVLVLLVISLISIWPRTLGPLLPRVGRTTTYITMILMEWLVLAFVWWGVRRGGFKFRELIGGKATFVSTLNDIGIAVVFMVVAGIILRALFALVVAVPSRMFPLLPRGPTELLLFLALSLTAGVCEEIIWRGYLQKQFTAFTGNVLAGTIIQAVIFGVAHGYQGLKYMSAITVYGYMLGLLAHWRRSLRPGMIAHGLQDSLVGLLGYLIH